MSSCIKETSSKYLSRPSPPYSASKCPEGKVLKGNDGNKYIVKKGEGIHHIAFEVENIEAEMKRLAALGFELLNEKPKNGADNKLVCFLQPKTTNGVLIELCQTLNP